MKKSIKLASHTGEQPIRVLKHNISNRFENLHGDFAKEIQVMINLGKLNRQISPQVNLNYRLNPFQYKIGCFINTYKFIKSCVIYHN
jgi:hypothetical protein